MLHTSAAMTAGKLAEGGRGQGAAAELDSMDSEAHNGGASGAENLLFEVSRAEEEGMLLAGKSKKSEYGIEGMWRHICSRKGLLALGIGQILALLLTTTGVTSSFLAYKGIDAPTTQSLLNYVLLALVYGTILLLRQKELRTHWCIYLVLAVVDVEANYAVVQAYQYTSLTSVALLDSWSIPCAMLLTWQLLHTQYDKLHVGGVLLCVTGLVLVLFSDVHSGDTADGSNPLLGDGLVILGSIAYAASNVGEEFLAKRGDTVELLAMLGFFGALVSLCQLLLLERHELERITWTPGAVAPFVVFSLALFSFYTLTPLLLQLSGSAMLNLSLLMSDIWAVAVRSMAFHQKVDWLYLAAFASVASGLVIYSFGGEPISLRSDPEADALNVPSDTVGEET